jgi:glutathione synthase/RimK-type ligase-like ATP-grasp enzyme
MTDVLRRLALVTCARLAPGHPDDAPLVPAFLRRGLAAQWVTWNDPDVDWSGFEAVVLRSTWDYFEHPAAFRAWLHALEAHGTPLLNPPALVRWNLDKRYLAELEAAGVPGVPSREAGFDDLPGVLAPWRGQDVVVKPTVSGGAWHTVRGIAGEPALDAALATLPRDARFLVQRFVPGIVDEGEWSLLFFAGRFSHAVLKRPAAGDYRVQPQFGGLVSSPEPDPALVDAARRALLAAEACAGSTATYARVDGVRVDGRFVLMEIELIEPSLFLHGDVRLADRFVEAIVGAIAAPCPARGFALS